MLVAQSVPFSESVSAPSPEHHRMAKGAQRLTFRCIEHIAIPSVDYDQVSRLVCSVCYKECVYKVSLYYAHMSAQHSPVCYLSLRCLCGCYKRHLYIFIDKITRLVCNTH